MENNKIPLLKPAMNYGALIGIALVIFSIITYFAGLSLSKWIGWFNYIIIFGCIVFAIIKYRDLFCNGYISYGKALGFGTLAVFFASIITGFYTFVFFKFIDPSMIDSMIAMAEEQMLQQNPNMPEEQIEMALKFTRKLMSPEIMFLTTIISNTFFGFIFTLIAAAIGKKNDNSFGATFQQ